MTTFLERFKQVLYAKDSILCVGLDAALPDQRKENVIPERYISLYGEEEGRLQFALDTLDKTTEFAVAAKPNDQYMFGLTPFQHKKMTNYIHSLGLIGIYDCKLGDIDDTAESKIYWMKKVGWDAITVHTQQGHLEQLVKYAHSGDNELGIIALTLMSNPGAIKGFKESKTGDKPDYLVIAEEVARTGADGCVVGATGHVTEDEITAISDAAGYDKFLLGPGVGTQGGDEQKLIRNWGPNLVVNVGRGVMYAADPRRAAEEYNLRFNEARVFYDTADMLYSVPGAFGINGDNPLILVSRQLSPPYADNRKLPSHPEIMKKISHDSLSMLKWKIKRKPDKIVTTATAGIAFAERDASALDVGMAYVVDKPKGHGMQTVLQGEVNEGEWCLVRDDLITTLGTIKKAVDETRKKGGIVEYAIVNVDRKQYSPQDLKDLGIQVIALTTMDERFAEYGYRKEHITKEQLQVFRDYMKDPLGWSATFVQTHPEWMKAKIQAGVKDGKFEVRDALEVYTKTHKGLLRDFEPQIREWLKEAKVTEKITEVNFDPDAVS